MKVEILGSEPENLNFAVIVSRYGDKWVFVRHKERDTYEIPGGHIEEGETYYEAAARELEEETGAEDYSLYHVNFYTVIREDRRTCGALFFAEISQLGDISPNVEIGERILLDTQPENQTYPQIQPVLFQHVLSWLDI